MTVTAMTSHDSLLLGPVFSAVLFNTLDFNLPAGAAAPHPRQK